MSKLIVASLVSLVLSGCLSRPDNLTIEQIDAYSKAGLDTYSCFQVAGPPPAGGLTHFTMPKGSQPNLVFGPNCVPLNASIGGLAPIVLIDENGKLRQLGK